MKIEWGKLKASDESPVELLQYHSHPANYPAATALAHAHGCSHIAFTAESILAACNKVIQLGSELINLPAVSPDGKALVLYAHDRDGTC